MKIRGRQRRLGVKSLGYPTYSKYLQGIEWKKTKIRFLNSNYVLRIDGVLACSHCRALQTDLQHPLHVHHKTYKNVGHEDITNDLLLVCVDCHDIIHNRHKIRPRSQKKIKKLPEPVIVSDPVPPDPPKLRRAYLVINTLKPPPVHLKPEAPPPAEVIPYPTKWWEHRKHKRLMNAIKEEKDELVRRRLEHRLEKNLHRLGLPALRKKV